jgi:hypothetical protein
MDSDSPHPSSLSRTGKIARALQSILVVVPSTIAEEA